MKKILNLLFLGMFICLSVSSVMGAAVTMKKTESYCFHPYNESIEIPIEVPFDAPGIVYCDYGVTVEIYAGDNFNFKDLGKREIFIDGVLFDKYTMGQKLNLHDNSAIAWEATAEVINGEVQYCESFYQGTVNTGLNVERYDCETEVIDII
jgi:hypothetical protein